MIRGGKVGNFDEENKNRIVMSICNEVRKFGRRKFCCSHVVFRDA